MVEGKCVNFEGNAILKNCEFGQICFVNADLWHDAAMASNVTAMACRKLPRISALNDFGVITV